jgi:hypothetical protein
MVKGVQECILDCRPKQFDQSYFSYLLAVDLESDCLHHMACHLERQSE